MKYLILMSLILAGCGGSPAAPDAEAAPVQASGNPPSSGGGASPAQCPPLFQNLQFIVPCPSNIGFFPQLLIKNGASVLAVVQTPGGMSVSLLPPGPYTTTDGRNCNYTVNVDGSVQ